MTLAIAFPSIDPVLFELGPFAVRWYSLAYIAGLVGAWRYIMWMSDFKPKTATRDQADDFFVWSIFAVILGGRLGYVLFYKPAFFAANPSEIFMVWQGGMSFHGGLLGVIVAIFWFCRQRKINTLAFFDMAAVAAPIGLFFGRLSNFINGELYGRATDVSWAMVFPGGGPVARHPSQLYEAALEGALLFVIMHLLWRSEFIRARPGILAGVFMLGYGASRAFIELFRQPDVHLGFLAGGTTMGQWLSAPMWLVGFWLVARALKKQS